MRIEQDEYVYHDNNDDIEICPIDIVHLGGRVKWLTDEQLEEVESYKRQGFIQCALRHGDDGDGCSLERAVMVNHLEDVLVRTTDMKKLETHLDDPCGWLEY